MNDLGVLASGIVEYAFPSDTGRFPVSYVSGWLEDNIGELNGLTHEEFYVDSTGGIGPSGLYPVEESIFKLIYEINYYDRSAREALRGIVWAGSAGTADSVTLVKEGDTTIQKVSKHQVSRTFSEFAEQGRDRLNELVFQYTRQKSSPVQVAGADAFQDYIDLE